MGGTQSAPPGCDEPRKPGLDRVKMFSMLSLSSSEDTGRKGVKIGMHLINFAFVIVK